MRLLQVVPTYYPAVRYGGPIRSVHGLASALVRRGHEVHVYTTSMDGPGDLEVPLGVPVDLDGVKVHYFRVPALRRLAFSPSLAAAVARSAAYFDVIHLQSVFLLPTLYAARAAERAKVPYVASPRGMLMRAALAGRSTRLKRAWLAAFERRTYREAAAVHVTAPLEAEELGDLTPRSGRIRVISNGLEWPADGASLSLGPFATVARPYALFLSRLSWKKGLDRLIRAWVEIPDLHLVIAGNDDEGYESTVRRLIAEAGVGDRVTLVGNASDEFKWALYREAAVFVLPSYAENFGNVIVEAMAMGCPVVTSQAVGAGSLVAQAGAGIVIDGAPASIVAAIRTLSADPAQARAMGQRGIGYVRARLGWDAIAAEMESLYAEITVRRRTP